MCFGGAESSNRTQATGRKTTHYNWCCLYLLNSYLILLPNPCLCVFWMCVYVSVFVDIWIKQHMCESQNTIFWSCFSPFNHTDTEDLTEVISLVASILSSQQTSQLKAEGFEMHQRLTKDPDFRWHSDLHV